MVCQVRKLLAALLVAAQVAVVTLPAARAVGAGSNVAPSTRLVVEGRPGETEIAEAARRLVEAGVLQGRTGGDLALDEAITRAEFITLLVRAFGREYEAIQRQGSQLDFSDVPGTHWADGYIAQAMAMAREAGTTLGVSSDRFMPEQLVTETQVVAFLAKFLRVKPVDNLPWPENYIRAMKDIRLLDEGASIRDIPATRGIAAYYVARLAHLPVKVESVVGGLHEIIEPDPTGAGTWRATIGQGVTIRYGSTASDGIHLVIPEVGITVRMRPLGVRPSNGKPDGKGGLLYSDAWPGADLHYTAGPSTHKLDIVVHRPDATPEWAFTVDVEGATVNPEVKTHGIDWKDASGAILFHMPRFAVTDAGGARTWAKVDLQGSGPWVLRLSVSKSWLQAQGRRFPVQVDPTTTVTIGSGTGLSGPRLGRFDASTLVVVARKSSAPYYAAWRSVDNGATWTPITMPAWTASEGNPRFYRVGNNWVLTTIAGSTVYVRYSSDGGATWDGPISLAASSAGTYYAGTGPNGIIVVSSTTVTGGIRLYVATSSDGSTWVQSTVDVTGLPTTSLSIGASPNVANVTWLGDKWVVVASGYAGRSCSSGSYGRDYYVYALTSSNGQSWMPVQLYTLSISCNTTGWGSLTVNYWDVSIDRLITEVSYRKDDIGSSGTLVLETDLNTTRQYDLRYYDGIYSYTYDFSSYPPNGPSPYAAFRLFQSGNAYSWWNPYSRVHTPAVYSDSSIAPQIYSPDWGESVAFSSGSLVYYRTTIPGYPDAPLIFNPTNNQVINVSATPGIALVATPTNRGTLPVRVVWEYSRDGGQTWQGIGASNWVRSGEQVATFWQVSDIAAGNLKIRAYTQTMDRLVSPPSVLNITLVGGTAAQPIELLSAPSGTAKAVAVGYLDANTMVAVAGVTGGNYTVYVSTDDGRTWSSVLDTGIPATYRMLASIEPTSRKVYWVSQQSAGQPISYGYFDTSSGWSKVTLGTISSTNTADAIQTLDSRYFLFVTGSWVYKVDSTSGTRSSYGSPMLCSSGTLKFVRTTPLYTPGQLATQWYCDTGGMDDYYNVRMSIWSLDGSTLITSERSPGEKLYGGPDAIWSFSRRRSYFQGTSIRDPVPEYQIWANQRVGSSPWPEYPKFLVLDTYGVDTFQGGTYGITGFNVFVHQSGAVTVLASSDSNPGTVYVARYDPQAGAWSPGEWYELPTQSMVDQVSLPLPGDRVYRWTPALVAAGNKVFFIPLRNTANTSPDAPLITAPSGVVGPSPVITWLFSDPDPGDVQTAARVRITNSSSIVWDSGLVYTSLAQLQVPAGTLQSGTYWVQVQVADRYGSLSPWSTPAQFTVDASVPSGQLSFGGGTNVVNTLSPTGVFSGLSPGVISYWLSADGGITWSAETPISTPPSVTLASAGFNRVAYRLKNTYGVVSPVALVTVLVDLSPPTISLAVNGGTAYTTSPTITATPTVSDNGGSGVAGWQYSLDNGNTWSSLLPATSTAITLPGGDGPKTILFRAKDNAGNVSATGSVSVTLDTTPPTVSVTAPTTTVGGQVSVSVSASDATSGVDSISISVDGGAFGPRMPFTSLVQLQVASGGPHTVSVRVYDRAGNYASATTTTSVELPTPPVVSLLINGGAVSTSTTLVTLQVTASDAVTPPASLQMRFSNGGGAWSAWEPYAQTKTWTIAGTAGMNTVCVEVKNTYGLTGDACASIRYDGGGPGLTTTIAAPTTTYGSVTAYVVQSNQVVLSIGASGVTDLRLRVDGGGWGDWEPFSPSKQVTVPPSEGLHQLDAQVRTAAGAVSAVRTVYVLLDRTPPTVSVAWAGGATAVRVNTPITLTVTATDNTPGALTYQYSLDGGTTWTTMGGNTASLSWSTTGLKTVKVRVTDAAGNQTTVDVPIWVLLARDRSQGPPLVGAAPSFFAKLLRNGGMDMSGLRSLFYTVWQPIVRLSDGTIIGFECLSRHVRDPGGRGVLDLLKGERGRKIDLYLARRALATLSMLEPGQTLFVNITVSTALKMATRSIWLAERPGVVWEISERFDVAWPETVQEEIKKWRDYALDDVGAGNGDLLKVLRWRPPWIKVDMELIRSIDRDPIKQELVRGIVQAAATYGGRVVAEGIERREELEVVQELGVQYGQGFLLGRPAEPAYWVQIRA